MLFGGDKTFLNHSYEVPLMVEMKQLVKHLNGCQNNADLCRAYIPLYNIFNAFCKTLLIMFKLEV